MNSKKKLGRELSEKVFEYLERNKSINYSHYGYCGVGFVMDGNAIHYTHIDEWLTYKLGNRYEPGGDYVGIIKTFQSRSEFIDWLSEESDYSLSGIEMEDEWYIDNQRITEKRLMRLLENENA